MVGVFGRSDSETLLAGGEAAALKSDTDRMRLTGIRDGVVAPWPFSPEFLLGDGLVTPLAPSWGDPKEDWRAAALGVIAGLLIAPSWPSWYAGALLADDVAVALDRTDAIVSLLRSGRCDVGGDIREAFCDELDPEATDAELNDDRWLLDRPSRGRPCPIPENALELPPNGLVGDPFPIGYLSPFWPSSLMK